MRNNNSNEKIMVKSNEVVVTSASTKLRMLMMMVSYKSADYEDLMIKPLESSIVPGVLCEHRPQVDLPANPWDKLHSNLHEPETGALRHYILLTGNKKSMLHESQTTQIILPCY